MNPLARAYYILRYLGPRVVGLRAGTFLRQKLGITRRLYAPRAWNSIALTEITRPGTPATAEAYARFKCDQAIPFLFPLGLPPAIPASISRAHGERQPSLAERLRLLEQDRCVYFLRSPSPEAIDWHRNPFDGGCADPDATWCDISDFLPSQGDPRVLWEPSRASWAIDLARAGPHGIKMDAGALYWRWVESWMAACEPFRGFQWKCGQESSVRFIALAIGFWSLAQDPATTAERWVQFARLAWATGYRVQHHIHYAISQKNNHALSEACGLLLIGHLFPELRESAKWYSLGRRVFAEEILRQTYADGSYIQHSMNYHRVMLQVSMLAMRLAELVENPFPRAIYDRIALCGEFLFQMLDQKTGRTPNYGNNDGACVLSLNECDFTNYRPTVQATHFLAHRKRLLSAGPWDEDLLWLFGLKALNSPTTATRPAESSAYAIGGYYTLRAANSWCMVRCHNYKDRPGQEDPLHFDLWWQGLNVLQDCGTYHYYAPGREDVELYFKGARGHNTIEVEGVPPIAWISRFLFFPWPRCRNLQFNAAEGSVIWFEGDREVGGYSSRRVTHKRTVLGLPNDAWMIIDDLLGSTACSASLRWHLLDVPFELDGAGMSMVLKTANGPVSLSVIGEPPSVTRFEVVRGRDNPGSVQGFAAAYYGERFAIPTLEVTFHCRLPQRMVTLIGCGVSVTGRKLDQDELSEQWGIRIGVQDHAVRLARPACRAAGTFIGLDTTDGATGDPKSTLTI